LKGRKGKLKRGKFKAKRIHSWALWRKLRDKYKASLTAVQSRMSNLKELDDNLCYAGGNPAGEVLSKELVLRGLNAN